MAVQDQSLRVLSFEARGGRAQCPHDPSYNYTIVHVGKIPLSLHFQSCDSDIRAKYRLQTSLFLAREARFHFSEVAYTSIGQIVEWALMHERMYMCKCYFG